MRQEIGPIASPDLIQWAPGLPKTRSGKIMRRILRKIAENDYGALGDTSTLADPAVVDDLIGQPHEPGVRPRRRRPSEGAVRSGGTLVKARPPCLRVPAPFLGDRPCPPRSRHSPSSSPSAPAPS